MFHVKHGSWLVGLWPVDVACGLWCVLVGGTHPIFLFLLEGWRNTSSPLAIPAQEFFTLVDVGLRQKPVIVNKIIKQIVVLRSNAGHN